MGKDGLYEDLQWWGIWGGSRQGVAKAADKQLIGGENHLVSELTFKTDQAHRQSRASLGLGIKSCVDVVSKLSTVNFHFLRCISAAQSTMGRE